MRIATFVIHLMIVFNASAQDGFEDVKIESQHLAQSVHMLTGAGGNIGVSAGPDGILIIDDQFAPLAQRIAAALADIDKGALKYVINTHYHGDHTGGNAWMREVKDATVFAHHNVRKRLAAKTDHKASELPVVTYAQGVKFHFNGETIDVRHLATGHTDGDSIVMFEKANVLHTGDHFFKDRFPFIDLDAGGTVTGYMANVQTMLDMIKADTQIIPGHGSLANKQDLQRFLDMIRDTSAYVADKKAAGISAEAIIAEGLEEQWKSWSWKFIDEARWINTLYR